MLPIFLLIATFSIATPLPTATVEEHLGGPALFINGVPQTGLAYMTYRPNARNFRLFAASDVHLHSFSSTATNTPYHLATPCWTGPDSFDYTQLDARARMILEADPKAWLLPRVFLGAPEWWLEKHPEAVMLFEDDEGDVQPLLIKNKQVPSWASEEWRKETGGALRRLIQHVEASDYGHRVIGYHLASGDTEEWMTFGGNDRAFSDYSQANQKKFRLWLRERYKDDAELQRIWGVSDLTLDKAGIPTKTERMAFPDRRWLDPKQDQARIDYALYTSDMTAETMIGFSRLVKEEVNNNRLVGVFYGYVLSLAGTQREQNGGHLALDKVMASPYIDFISSPTNYLARELGTGYPFPMSLVDSIKAHGKLWFNENDQRTFLSPRIKVGELGKTATVEETILNQQREFSWSFVNRHGMWWFDMGGGWYDDPKLLEALQGMEEISRNNIDVNSASVSEVAFVVDDKSSAYLRPDWYYGWSAQVLQQPMLGHMGTPYALIALSDLPELVSENGELPYKLWIFANTFAPSEAEIAAILRIRERPNRSLLWLGPAGLYADGEITGFSLIPHEGALKTWKAHPTANAVDGGWKNLKPYGTGRPGPAWTVDINNATVLATYAGTEIPALVGRVVKGRRDYWSGVPLLSSELLHDLAQEAGVHCYIPPGEAIWVSQDLLAVHAKGAGHRSIRLPVPRPWTNLWTGEIHGVTSSIEINLKKHETALIRLR